MSGCSCCPTWDTWQRQEINFYCFKWLRFGGLLCSITYLILTDPQYEMLPEQKPKKIVFGFVTGGSEEDGEPCYTVVKHLEKLLLEITWKVDYIHNEFAALQETIRKHNVRDI